MFFKSRHEYVAAFYFNKRGAPAYRQQGRFYTASEPRTYIRKTKKIFPQYMV